MPKKKKKKPNIFKAKFPKWLECWQSPKKINIFIKILFLHYGYINDESVTQSGVPG
jgi:hypothetical protein